MAIRFFRVCAFVLVPLVGIASPFVALPVVTSRFGSGAWEAIVVGQSLGLALSVVVESGWTLDGPQRVARASRDRVAEYAALSLSMKSMLLLPVAVMAATVAWMMSPDEKWLSSLTAVGTTATGLTLSWVLIGLGRPLLLFLSDALVRLAGVLIAAGLMLTGVDVWIYPVMGLIVPSIVSPVLIALVIGARGPHLARVSRRRLVGAIRAQSSVTVGRLTSSAYMTVPTLIVTLLAPSALAVFGATDRLARMALSVLAAVPNAMQRWVGSAPRAPERARRARRAVGMNLSLGLVSGTGFAVLARPVSAFVFQGVADIPFAYALCGGLLIAIVCTSRATGNIGLVAVRRVGVVVRSAMAGAAIGVPAILLLTLFFGGLGASGGVLLAEVIVLAIQLPVVFRRRP